MHGTPSDDTDSAGRWASADRAREHVPPASTCAWSGVPPGGGSPGAPSWGVTVSARDGVVLVDLPWRTDSGGQVRARDGEVRQGGTLTGLVV